MATADAQDAKIRRQLHALSVNILSQLCVLALCLTIFLTGGIALADPGKPLYKPSSRSPAAIDILSSAYGASRSAPNALNIGDHVEDFSVAAAGGGLVSLREARAQGPVAIIFYRGHW